MKNRRTFKRSGEYKLHKIKIFGGLRDVGIIDAKVIFRVKVRVELLTDSFPIRPFGGQLKMSFNPRYEMKSMHYVIQSSTVHFKSFTFNS